MMPRTVKGRKTVDYNALARKGIFFCASCGKQIGKTTTGHCRACISKGY